MNSESEGIIPHAGTLLKYNRKSNQRGTWLRGLAALRLGATFGFRCSAAAAAVLTSQDHSVVGPCSRQNAGYAARGLERRTGSCIGAGGTNNDWSFSQKFRASNNPASARGCVCMHAAALSQDVPQILPTYQISLLLDDSVSRKHAVISHHDGAYYYMNLLALNGSRINGQQAPAWVGVRLNFGDTLEIGCSTFICLEMDERCCEAALVLIFGFVLVKCDAQAFIWVKSKKA